jgi:hypothetical protein
MTTPQRPMLLMVAVLLLGAAWETAWAAGAPKDQSGGPVTHRWNVYSPSNPASNPWSFQAESLSVNGGALVFMQTRDGSLVPTAIIPANGYSHVEIVD